MDQPAKRTAFSLHDTKAPLKWTILLLASLAFIVPLELIHLPAALLLGAMAAAILVAVFDGKAGELAGQNGNLEQAFYNLTAQPV